jgi:large subunit ribosomal protein L33
MAKDKNIRDRVKLKSTASEACYYVTKKRRNTAEKLELKKYDYFLRKHVLFREVKG